MSERQKAIEEQVQPQASILPQTPELEILKELLDELRVRITAIERYQLSESQNPKTISEMLDGWDERLMALEENKLEISSLDEIKKDPPVLTIQFRHNSADLTENAKIAISSFLASADKENIRLAIVGFADSTGSSVYNQNISLRRAVSVRRALVDHGVPVYQISVTQGLGEEGAPVQTDDEISERQNRAVLVYTY